MFTPGEGKTCMPYDRVPNKQTVVAWSTQTTGTVRRQSVNIKLPPRFSNARWPEIILYVNPDSERVSVAYNLNEIDGGVRREIDSNGDTFEIGPANVKTDP